MVETRQTQPDISNEEQFATLIVTIYNEHLNNIECNEINQNIRTDILKESNKQSAILILELSIAQASIISPQFASKVSDEDFSSKLQKAVGSFNKKTTHIPVLVASDNNMSAGIIDEAIKNVVGLTRSVSESRKKNNKTTIGIIANVFATNQPQTIISLIVNDLKISLQGNAQAINRYFVGTLTKSAPYTEVTTNTDDQTRLIKTAISAAVLAEAVNPTVNSSTDTTQKAQGHSFDLHQSASVNQGEESLPIPVTGSSLVEPAGDSLANVVISNSTQQATSTEAASSAAKHKYKIVAVEEGKKKIVKITRNGKEFRDYGIDAETTNSVQITGKNATTTIFLTTEGEWMKNVVTQKGIERTTPLEDTLTLSESLGGKYTFRTKKYKQDSKQQDNVAKASTTAQSNVPNTQQSATQGTTAQESKEKNTTEIKTEANTTSVQTSIPKAKQDDSPTNPQNQESKSKDNVTKPEQKISDSRADTEKIKTEDNAIAKKVEEFANKIVGIDETHKNKHVRSNKGFTGKLLHEDKDLETAKTDLRDYIKTQILDLLAEKDTNETAHKMYKVIVENNNPQEMDMDSAIKFTLQAFSHIKVKDVHNKNINMGATAKYRGLKGGHDTILNRLTSAGEFIVAAVKYAFSGGKDDSMGKWQNSQTELVINDPKQFSNFLNEVKAETKKDASSAKTVTSARDQFNKALSDVLQNNNKVKSM